VPSPSRDQSTLTTATRMLRAHNLALADQAGRETRDRAALAADAQRRDLPGPVRNEKSLAAAAKMPVKT